MRTERRFKNRSRDGDYIGAVFENCYRTAWQLVRLENMKLPPHLRFPRERLADLSAVAAWMAIHGHNATCIGRAMGRHRTWVTDRIREVEFLLEPMRVRVTLTLDCEF